MPTERRKERILRVAATRLTGVTLVIDELYRMHNISAVLRSAEAFGVGTVHIIAGRNPFRVNRAITHGCHRWMDIPRYRAPGPCLQPLRDHGWEIWAAVPTDGPLAPHPANAPPCHAETVPLPSIPLASRMAFVFGNESDGISAETRALCSGTFTIPTCGFSESLNVSVAAAVTLHSITRRYRAWIGDDSDLTAHDRKAVAERWLRDDETAHRR